MPLNAPLPFVGGVDILIAMKDRDRTALYVRIPTHLSEGLDRMAFERKASKQDLVAAALRRITVETRDDEMTVGHAEFRPSAPADVLTLQGVADLLQAAPEDVAALAETGELPGRKVGGEWRFARDAVLRWLGRAD
jgi:excisionase family DNA binding protein